MDDEPASIPTLVPLFPLPEVVLFPHTIIPLHVFEPRYREMMSDALEGDRVIAVALLKPDYEPLYYTHRAPIHETVGVGHIAEYEQIEDGNYNLLLRGIGRAVILDEFSDHPYRVARISPLDSYCSGDEDHAQQLHRELMVEIRHNTGLDAKLRQQWLRLCKVPIGLDVLADLLAAGIPADSEWRQCLLDEPDALTRSQMLLRQMRALAGMAQNHQRLSDPGQHGLN